MPDLVNKFFVDYLQDHSFRTDTKTNVQDKYWLSEYVGQDHLHFRIIYTESVFNIHSQAIKHT